MIKYKYRKIQRRFGQKWELNAKLKRIFLLVWVKLQSEMVLKLLFVLLVSSVVIASENPCDNVEGGIPRKASYVKFNGGFFFM